MKPTLKITLLALVALTALLIVAPRPASAARVNQSPAPTATTTCPGISCGLVAYWTMDGADLKNNVADKSGAGRNGNLVGLDATSTIVVAGKIGQALQVKNVVGAHAVEINSVSGKMAGDVSVSLWFRVPRRSNNLLFHLGDALSTNDIIMCIGTISGFCAGTTLQFGQYTGAAFTLSNSGLVPKANTWYHVVGTYNSTDGTKIWVNGMNYGRNTTATRGGTIAAKAGIGKTVGDTNFFGTATFDDVRVYDRALATSTVQQLYNLGSAKVNQSISNVDINSGLLAWWTMDGNKMINNVTDSSGNGLNGNFVNVRATTSAQVAGKIGQGVYFNGNIGSGSRYIKATSTSLNFTSSDFAYSWWMKLPKAINQSTYPIGSGNYQIGGTYIGLGLSGSKLFVNMNTNQISPAARQQVATNKTDLGDNKWHHIVTRRQGAVGEIWVDGAQETYSTRNAIIDPTPSPYDFVIGRLPALSAGWITGSIDDVRIYNTYLSTSTIKQLYNLGSAKINQSLAGINSGLVGWWTFDGKDLKTNVADKSGQGNNGYMTGFTSTSTAVVAGKLGQGLKFDGVNDYVNLGSDIINTSTTTVCVWAYAKSYGANSYGRILDNGKLLIYIAGNTYLSISSDGASTQKFSSAGSLILNKWQHWCATRDATGIANIYLNGLLNGTGNQTSGTPAAGTTNMFVGGKAFTVPNSRTWNGSLDDVRIYNRVLSATEIRQLYNMGK